MNRNRLVGNTLGVWVCLTTAVASADVYEFDIAKIRVYEQLSETGPTTPVAYLFNTFFEADPGDATMVSLNSMSIDEQFPGQWELIQEFGSQAELNAAYPSGGSYTMSISGGTLGNRSELMGFPTESYPSPPEITAASFTNMQSADPTQDLLIEWETPGAGVDLVVLSIYDPIEDDYIVDFDEIAASSYTIDSALLTANRSYEIELLFFNGDIGSGSPAPGFGTGALRLAGFASITNASFTTGTGEPCVDVEFAGLGKFAMYAQSADNTQPTIAEGYSFSAFLNTPPNGATAASVSGGAAVVPMTEYSPGQWDNDEELQIFATKAELDAEFPSSTVYTMHIEGGTLGVRDQDLPIGSDDYPSAPYLTGDAYSQLQGLDPSTAVTLNWAPPPGNVTRVFINIYDLTNDFDVFNSELPVETTSIMIGADQLMNDTQYELLLTFAAVPQIAADDCPGFGSGADVISGFASDNTILFTTMGTAVCAADLTGDGLLNFFDVSAFLVAYQSQDLIADFNGDGMFNFFDVSAFLVAFQGGCP